MGDPKDKENMSGRESKDGASASPGAYVTGEAETAFAAENKKAAKAVVRAVLSVALVLYLALFVRMMFFRPGYLRPEVGASSWLEYASARTNFLPLRSTIEYISAIKSGVITPFEIAKNLLGNFFLFFPFGFVLPLLFRFFRSLGRSAAVLAAAIAVSELIQLITMVGVCDIDDMILNYIGALTGFALAYLILKRRKRAILKDTEKEIEKICKQDE